MLIDLSREILYIWLSSEVLSQSYFNISESYSEITNFLLAPILAIVMSRASLSLYPAVERHKAEPVKRHVWLYRPQEI